MKTFLLSFVYFCICGLFMCGEEHAYIYVFGVEARLQVSYLKNYLFYFLRPNLTVLELWEGFYGWAVSPGKHLHLPTHHEDNRYVPSSPTSQPLGGNPSASVYPSLGLHVCAIMSIFPASKHSFSQDSPEEKNQCETEWWCVVCRWYQSWIWRMKFHQKHSVKSGSRDLWEISPN